MDDSFLPLNEKERLTKSVIPDLWSRLRRLHEKNLDHNFSPRRQYSTKLNVSIAVLMMFRVLLTGVTQAYLQTTKPLGSDILFKPCSGFRFEAKPLLKLKNHYGLVENGIYWDRTLRTQIGSDYGINTCNTHISIYYKHNNQTLIGVFETYADDT